ncbi:MAG TPA: hypothetical protein VK308_14515 [Pyrinomonadaceae bacterium]|nr:hypothetical protein [Pyrinomonadaceae bacterium]
MAISKIGKSQKSSQILQNVLKNEHSEIIGGTFYGTRREILAQNLAVCRVRPAVKNNMIHIIEYYYPGEEVSDETINYRAKEKIRRLGCIDFFYLVVKQNLPNLHVHILLNRIKWDGSLFDDSFIALRAIAVTKELDAELGMHKTEFDNFK